MNAHTPLSEIMECEVATLDVADRLDLAEDIMRLGRVRHLPVLEGSKLIGIVSSRDLLAAGLSKALDFDASQRRTFMRSVAVAEVMSREVMTLGPTALLRDAVALMLERKIGSLPVVDADGKLVGLVTETDLLRATLLAGDDEVDVSPGPPRREASERIGGELDELKRVRDELRVRIHLGKAEARELWEGLEHKWSQVEGRARRVGREAEEPLHDIGDAARLLVDEIRDGYRRIRGLL